MTTPPIPTERSPLVYELRPGDPSALSAMLDQQAQFLEDQVSRGLGARLREVVEPEDVLQDVRVRILRLTDRVTFDSQSRLRGWLAAVVRNCIVDLHRRYFCTARRAQSPLSLEDSGVAGKALGLRLGSSQSGPSSVARLSERQVLLQRILARLRPDQRRLLDRVHFGHQALAEIAAQDGATTGALRMRYLRAIEACRQSMEQLTRGAGA